MSTSDGPSNLNALTPSERNALLRQPLLPYEILCLCFTFLPDLCSCVAVSQVSRPWRAAAVGFPALWARIEFGEFKRRAELDVLSTALARSGQHPVRLTFRAVANDVPMESAVVDAVAPHMHRMQVLSFGNLDGASLSEGGDITCFLRDAPLLEGLAWRTTGPSRVGPDFLGGVAGRLHTVSMPCPVLPRACPALASVARLTMSASGSIDRYPTSTIASFAPLFSLCPRLVELSVVNILPWTADFPPSTPAPPSLVRLTLVGACDLIALLPRFRGQNTSWIYLRMPRSALSAPYAGIEHAVELSLSEPRGTFSMHLTVLFPGGKRTEVEFPFGSTGLAESYDRAAAYLMRQRLARVERWTLPLAALRAFAREFVLAQSRLLADVRLVAQERDGVFPWGELDALAQLPPSVTSVALEASYGPDTQHKVLHLVLFLDALLDVFERWDARARGVTFLVQGFPEEHRRQLKLENGMLYGRIFFV